MGYVERNLEPGEEVVYQAKLHWILFLKPVAWWAAAIALYLIAGRLLPHLPGGVQSVGHTVRMWGSLILFALAFLQTLSVVLTYISSEFAVTNRRLIVKVGLVRRESLETLLSRVEGLDVNQTIPGRLLDYGTIEIRGMGGHVKAYTSISHPIELRSAVYRQVEARREQTLYNP
ncbi:MAG: PH domain-containing protein [Candidatus Hydrogenedentota bacterium]